jgi:hypothetical protein
MGIAKELRLDAQAFRENVVYTQDGEPVRLIANAARMEQGAYTIEALLDIIEQLEESLTADGYHSVLVDDLRDIIKLVKGERTNG